MDTPTPDQVAAAEKEADDEISKFSDWFTRAQDAGGLGEQPLARPESAILKTYLIHKKLGRF